MSVYDRLTNAGGGSKTPSVYDRLIANKTPAPAESTSVYDRLMNKKVSAPVVSTPTPVATKLPFESTKTGIAVNTVLGLPKALLDTGLSILRAPGRAAAALEKTITGESGLTPTTLPERILYGNEPIKSLGEQTKETKETLKGFGISDPLSGALAPIGVGGFTLMDLYPGTSGKGAAIKQLAKETSEVVIKDILKKEFKVLSEDAIKEIVPQLAKTTDKKATQQIISDAINKKITPALAQPQQVSQIPSKVGQEISAPQRQTTAMQQRLLGEKVDIVEPVSSLPKTTPDINITQPIPGDKVRTIADFPPETQQKIFDLADAIDQKIPVGEDTINSLRRLFKQNDLNLPSTKKGIAEYINTARASVLEKDITISRVSPTSQNTEMARQLTREANAAANNIPERIITPSIAQKIKKVLSNQKGAVGYNFEKKPLSDIDKYISEEVIRQETARNLGKVKGTTAFYNTLKKSLVDFAAPIEDTLRVATKKRGISMLPEADITNQIDRVLKAPSEAGRFARANGLDDIIRKAPDLNKLDQYLIAKQSIALDTRGIATGRNIAMDTKLVKELAPVYDDLAKQTTKYSQDLLDYSVESGLISKDVANILKKRYPDYVPVNRIFSEMEKSGGEFGSKAIASLSRQTVVRGIKGSERVIENPTQSLFEKTVDAFKQGERNKAAKILASYEKIPGNPFGLRELKGGETAANTISFLDNGVKRTFEVNKEIADAAKVLNTQQMNTVLRVLAVPTRLLKLGTTGISLPFIAKNITRDVMTSLLNTNTKLKYSIANPSVFLRSLFEAVKHGNVYDEMVKNGALSTSFDLARGEITPTLARIRASRSLKDRTLYGLKNPIASANDLLTAVENVVGRSEEFTRITQYIGAKKDAIAKGFSPADAEIMASRAARENTVNFARRGEFGQVLNSLIPYLNAGIQGSRTFVRTAKTNPARTAMRLGLYIFTPMAAVTAYNMSDPKRREAYNDIQDYEKEGNFVIVPPNPVKNEDGTWEVIKIPITQEAASLATMLRRSIEAAHGQDPVSVNDIASSLIGSVSPFSTNPLKTLSSVTPQAIKPAIETVVNRNLYTGMPIVSATMEKLSPENQYKPYTSGTVRLASGQLGLSPLKVEAFLKGTFGSIAPQAINIIDNVLAGADIIPKDQIGGKNVIKSIVSNFSEARGGKSEQLDTILTDVLTKQADDAFKTKVEAEGLYKTFKALPKKQAAQKFTELTKSNPKMAKAITTVATDEKLGLSYADRMLKTLQVNNGNRAMYIAEELNSLKTMEEKKTKWQEYVDKKIITPQVATQISSIIKKK